MDEVVRIILKEGKTSPCSGAALGRTLGLTRAAVHKRITRLRKEGFVIEGATRTGYSLKRLSDRPEGTEFSPGWGRPFFFSHTTTSTQDEVKRRAMDGAPEGTLVVAGEQTVGRGRLGRTWTSLPGGLWYSLLLRSSLAPSVVPGLVLVAALDWVRILMERGVPARVKWPNDVWVGDRKLAGILTEASTEADRVHWVALGVGLNVNNDPPAHTHVPAVSLKQVTGKDESRRELLKSWMERFHKSYGDYRRKGLAFFRHDLDRFSLLKGRMVFFDNGGRREKGRVLGLDPEGRLRVKTSTRLRVVTAGDVFLRK